MGKITGAAQMITNVDLVMEIAIILINVKATWFAEMIIVLGDKEMIAAKKEKKVKVS